jgi:hypothetical protein
MKTAIKSILSVLGITCMLMQNTHGAGVAVFKEQPFHQDEYALPIVYSNIRQAALTYQFDMGAKTVAYDSSKIAAYVTVPALPDNIKDESEVSFLRKSVEELTAFAARFKKTDPILKPHIDHLGKAVSRFELGEVRLNGQWISKEAHAATLRREMEVKEAARRAAAESERQFQLMKEKEAALAEAQRQKGLEKYGQQWLPINEVRVLQKRDREIAVADDEVRSKSITSLMYSVFQVIPKGMLIKPIEGSIKNGGLNVDLVCLYGAAQGRAAEGDLYKDNVYWCGTYSYTTQAGKDATIHAYCLNRDEAIERVKNMLFGNEEKKPPQTASNSSDATRSQLPEPLKGATSTGSGFFVGTQGHFVTNAHVVGSASDVSIYHEGKSLPAKVVHISKVADLALLKADIMIEGIEVAEGEIDLGMDVYAIGFPNPDIQGTEVKVTKGVISSKRGFNDDDTRFQIDAAIQPGNSGGPLCDSNGHVVGVVVSALNSISVAKATGAIPQNVNYAIKASELSAFLRSRSVKILSSSERANGEASTNLKSAVSRSGMVVVKE